MSGKVCPQCGEEYPLKEKFCSRDGAVLISPSAANDALEGQIIAGRFHILRRLGEGGMGQVYLAEHLRMKRKCALKVMRPHLTSDPDAIVRFNHEAENASRVEHPNVAAVFDFGDAENGLVYLAMEFIEGEPLSTLLAREAPLAPERAVEIVRQTAEALQAAHDLGITHRDLKPDNIMLKRRGGGEQVKVVDFGISKVASRTSQKVTATGAIIGTPAYMSPEQVKAIPLDGRSDNFSLAIVAFEMLTGKLPFEGDTAMETMAARLNGKPRALSDVRPEVRWGQIIEKVMARALADDRDARYQSATEFAREFADAVATIATAEQATVVFRPSNADSTRPLPAPRAPANRRHALIGGGAAVAILSGAIFYATRDRGTNTLSRDTTAAAMPTPTPAEPKSAPVTQSKEQTSSAPAVTPTKTADAPAQRAADPAVNLAGSSRSTPLTRDALLQQLEALETPGARAGISFQFAPARTTYAVGDSMHFRVKSDRGGYLTLLDVSANGELTVLTPSALIKDVRLEPGKEIVVPGSADGDIRVGLPAGPGVVRAIVTSRPVTINYGTGVATSTDDPQLFSRIRRQLGTVTTNGAAAWTTQAIAYTVRP
jgi:serine/threonine-protein kinase